MPGTAMRVYRRYLKVSVWVRLTRPPSSVRDF